MPGDQDLNLYYKARVDALKGLARKRSTTSIAFLTQSGKCAYCEGKCHVYDQIDLIYSCICFASNCQCPYRPNLDLIQNHYTEETP